MRRPIIYNSIFLSHAVLLTCYCSVFRARFALAFVKQGPLVVVPLSRQCWQGQRREKLRMLSLQSIKTTGKEQQHEYQQPSRGLLKRFVGIRREEQNKQSKKRSHDSQQDIKQNANQPSRRQTRVFWKRSNKKSPRKENDTSLISLASPPHRRRRHRLMDNTSLASTTCSSPSSSERRRRLPIKWSPPPPAPTTTLPVRFLRAAKGNVKQGWERYNTTRQWREQNDIDCILRQPNWSFDTIKQHYRHYLHGHGRNGEPCYYECVGQTNLTALQQANVTVETLLRHYIQVTEFQWQVVNRNDTQQSIYVIDCQGIRLRDFVGNVVTFVRKASQLSNLHYPERAGHVFVIYVPAWFQVVWNVVKPWVDPVTLEKIHILRHPDAIQEALLSCIDANQLPANYGGTSTRLGASSSSSSSQQEALLRQWIVEHNNQIALGNYSCGGIHGNCPICTWAPARSY